MPHWRITSFDRVLGRGTCASGVGELAFDANVADVDDFVAGEEVDVSLRPHGGTFVVTRIAPTGFRDPFAGRAAAKPFDLDAVCDAIRGYQLYLNQSDDDEVVVSVDDTHEHDHAHWTTLRFERPSFVQMPIEMEAASIRAFEPAEIARIAPELVRHWPRLAPNAVVFRIEPTGFGEGAGYVIARAVRVDRRPWPLR